MDQPEPAPGARWERTSRPQAHSQREREQQQRTARRRPGRRRPAPAPLALAAKRPGRQPEPPGRQPLEQLCLRPDRTKVPERGCPLRGGLWRPSGMVALSPQSQSQARSRPPPAPVALARDRHRAGLKGRPGARGLVPADRTELWRGARRREAGPDQRVASHVPLWPGRSRALPVRAAVAHQLEPPLPVAHQARALAACSRPGPHRRQVGREGVRSEGPPPRPGKTCGRRRPGRARREPARALLRWQALSRAREGRHASARRVRPGAGRGPLGPPRCSRSGSSPRCPWPGRGQDPPC